LKGSKKVLLKNVLDAKFRQSGLPIARRIWDTTQLPHVTFDSFFIQILFHELSHGLGPGIIVGPDGKKVENRILLKNLYSTIEEAKADVAGLWNLFYAIDNGIVTAIDKKAIMGTNAALHFRSMRFGIHEAHGRGTAVQWNWLREKGAIVPAENGRFRVIFDKYEAEIKALAHELLMIEATGDYDRAQKLLDQYGKSTPEIESVNERLKDIPVDIGPLFVGAGEK
ncbi:MAG TPA: hypothetical protein VI753_00655, partial [Anaerolineales bacterium]|nr:hypothetical protein [Anaerolineales bacterium]